jgi:hypothetical protein
MKKEVFDKLIFSLEHETEKWKIDRYSGYRFNSGGSYISISANGRMDNPSIPLSIFQRFHLKSVIKRIKETILVKELTK